MIPKVLTIITIKILSPEGADEREFIDLKDVRAGISYDFLKELVR
jgi:hypothetical protein